MHVYFQFISAAALLLILPGPTNALLMTAGAERGTRHSLNLILAEIVAYGLAITPLFVFSEVLGSWRALGGVTLKSIAIALVLFLALRMWKNAGRQAKSDGAPLVTLASVFWMTLLNPKSLIFAFAIFPPVAGGQDIAAKVALFVLLAAITGTSWIAGGAVLGRGSMAERGPLIGRVAALVLCGFAIYLGTSVVTETAHLVSSAA